ncbi:IBR domain protein [Fusarium beomiforme]|uniref:IBR domain protein n=1 Tax=Fusarium beomiforme TaxID=44412 RepID=A0A9P5ASC4_9HYPO|nr:IBR domain protein [Fusarium beomiforme]
MDEQNDYAIALSIAQAVEADAELIATIVREKEQARRVFEFAWRLNRNPRATPEGNNDNADDPAESTGAETGANHGKTDDAPGIPGADEADIEDPNGDGSQSGTSIEAGVANCTRCNKKTCLNCMSDAHSGVCADDPESERVLRLAEQHGWRRCEQCRRVVELAHGCSHITCLCKYQFCYACGKRWKTCQCPQWNENHLVERAKGAVAAAVPGRLDEVRACGHQGYFERVYGQAECENCGQEMRNFILECQICGIDVCHRCLQAYRNRHRQRN